MKQIIDTPPPVPTISCDSLKEIGKKPILFIRSDVKVIYKLHWREGNYTLIGLTDNTSWAQSSSLQILIRANMSFGTWYQFESYKEMVTWLYSNANEYNKDTAD